MSLPIDSGNAVPTHIQEFDGFDVTTIDTNRWETPVQNGSTTIAQSGGELVFTNTGAGTTGLSYLQSIRKFGKNWRKSVDLKLATTTGTKGELSLNLYKDANNYIKMGPYKGGAINCNCLMRYKVAGSVEYVVPLTADVVNTTEFSTYTFGIIGDTIICYYRGTFMTSVPFGEMFNFNVRIEAGTGANTDTLSAKANDYETINHLDTLLMTIGKIVKDIHDTMGTSNIIDISGDITLADTTEVFLTFDQATYGTKFKVNLFGDLEGQRIDQAGLTPNGGAFVDYTTECNNLKSNSIPLVNTPTAGDCFYFRSLTQFHSLDIYLEQGAGNTDNSIIWEYWNGAAWVQAVAGTDGTIYNTYPLGKSGRVSWAANTVLLNGYYQMRARVTVAGVSKPVATHIQINPDGETGFDALATVFSTLTVSIYRKRGDGTYGSLPSEVGLPYTQCILYRNLAITDLMAWSDIKIGLKLSATPTGSIIIPYTGFVETIET